MNNGTKALAIAAFGMVSLAGTIGLTLYPVPEADRTVVAATLVFLQGVVTTAVGVLSGAYRPDGSDVPPSTRKSPVSAGGRLPSTDDDPEPRE